jgi:hypothetical protein
VEIVDGFGDTLLVVQIVNLDVEVGNRFGELFVAGVEFVDVSGDGDSGTGGNRGAQGREDVSVVAADKHSSGGGHEELAARDEGNGREYYEVKE